MRKVSVAIVAVLTVVSVVATVVEAVKDAYTRCRDILRRFWGGSPSRG